MIILSAMVLRWWWHCSGDAPFLDWLKYKSNTRTIRGGIHTCVRRQPRYKPVKPIATICSQYIGKMISMCVISVFAASNNIDTVTMATERHTPSHASRVFYLEFIHHYQLNQHNESRLHVMFHLLNIVYDKKNRAEYKLSQRSIVTDVQLNY